MHYWLMESTHQNFTFLMKWLLVVVLLHPMATTGADAGLPFTEEFTNNNLRDSASTTANWNTNASKLSLSYRHAKNSLFPAGVDIPSEISSFPSLAMGDVNADGKPDLVSFSSTGSRIFFHSETSGISPYESIYNRSLSSANTNGGALADINKDGFLDMLVARSGTNQTIRIYLNNKNLSRPYDDSPFVIDVEAGPLEAVDVNGDDYVDLLTSVKQPDGYWLLQLYLNNKSSQPFEGVVPQSIGSPGSYPTDLVVADFNNDGHKDLVEAKTNLKQLYLNNGNILNPFDQVAGQMISSDNTSTYAIDAADFDGDGDIDLIEGNRNYSNNIFLNDGDGNPFDTEKIQLLGTGANSTYAVKVIDIDNDGDVDFVTANYNSQLNYLYRNNGTSVPFDSSYVAEAISSDQHDSTGVAVADIDFDGDQDILIGNSAFPVRLYTNQTSQNTFSTVDAQEILIDQNETTSAVAGDFNNDGYPDVVIAASQNASTRLYTNTKTSVPFNGANTSQVMDENSGVYWASAIDATDYNRDGFKDLLIATSVYTQDNLIFFHNNSASPFSSSSSFAIPRVDADSYNSSYAVASGDVDNDGDVDFIVGNYTTNDQLFINDGSVGSGENPFSSLTYQNIPTVETGVGHRTASLKLVDLNADGMLDLIVGIQNLSTPNYYYLNNGTTTPFSDGGKPFKVPTGKAVYNTSIATGDIDQDGDIDVIFGNSKSNVAKVNTLYLNQGGTDPFWVDPVELNTDERYGADVNLVDYDQDGDLDLFQAFSGQTDQLLIHDGESVNPYSSSPIDISTDNLNSRKHLLEDFDLDGDIDLLTVAYNQSPRVYINELARNSVTSWKFTEIGNAAEDKDYASRKPAVADLNNDGLLDLVLVNSSFSGVTSENRYYFHDGVDAPYDDAVGQDFGSSDSETWDVAIGDLNNDGWLDVVTANTGQTNKLYTNNSGTLGAGTVISSDVDQTHGIYLADINSDGWLDVLTAESDSVNKLYLNDKSGDPFDTIAAIEIGSELASSRKIIAADFDNDGDLDLAVANFNGSVHTNHYYKNTSLSSPFGSSSTAYSIGSGNYNTQALAAGDVDNDGDIDLITGNANQYNRLYLNDGDSDPFDSIVDGLPIGGEGDVVFTTDILLYDINRDGFLDMIAINASSGFSKLYINNASGPGANPFAGVTGIDIGSDAASGGVMADLDYDGSPDFVESHVRNTIDGSTFFFEKSRAYRALPFSTSNGKAVSLEVDTTTDIATADLTISYTAQPSNTRVSWFLSNNGGQTWLQAYPGQTTVFPVLGDDLRWRAELESLSSKFSPLVNEVNLSAERDRDQDTVLDHLDNCPDTANSDQADNDADSQGDACDPDDDNDTILDVDDLFPFNAAESADFDGDCTGDFYLTTSGNGCGDNSDSDIDGDGIDNEADSLHPFNVKPDISGTAATSVTPGNLYEFTPVVYDPAYDDVTDGGNLVFEISNKPVWASFNNENGELAGIPSNDDYGSYTNIIISVSDGHEIDYLSSFDIAVTDTRSPVTKALPPSGTYNSSQSVYLSCSDGTVGSGCNETFYSLTDVNAETPGVFVKYLSAILITDEQKLWFYSVDSSGNVESNNFAIYYIDTQVPQIVMGAPANNDQLNQLIDINGTSSDAYSGITAVELQISGDNNTYLDSEGNWMSGPVGGSDWVIATSSDNWATWNYDTSAINFWSHDTVYSVTARATDNAGNIKTTTHSFHYYNGDPAYTTLDLNLSSSSVIYGGEVDASFKLTEVGDPESDLSGSEVYLIVTDPDYDETAEVNPGKQYTIGPFATNADGQITVTGLGKEGNGLLPDGDDEGSNPDDLLFNKKGTWTLQAQYAGSLALAAADSPAQILLVGTSAGYAVIVEGKAPNGEGLASHNKTGNRIYRTLLDRGFADQNIFYFNYYYNDDTIENGFARSDANLDGTPDRYQLGVGMDGLPDKATIQDVLTNQLYPLVAFNPAPVYLVMVDHGASDYRFLLDEESISPTELDSWLDTFETNLGVLDTSGEALAEPRVAILGYCYSGGFVPELSGDNRIVIASSAADEESYKGPLESDGIRVGEYFLEELFQELGKGQSFKDSFKVATDKTETYTRQGGESVNTENAYFDDAEQHPLLDDDGDAQGSNVLDESASDGSLAALTILGTGPNYDTNSLENPAAVSEVTPTVFLSSVESSAGLSLKANDNTQVSQAYVEIRKPQTTLASQDGTEQLETSFIKRIMLAPGQEGNPETDRFYIEHNNDGNTYTGFDQSGKYEVYYYVEDVETGDISPASRSVVYKNKGDNTAPTAISDDANATWELLSPADTATTKTVVIVDWEDAEDADGLSYTLEVSDTTDFETNPTFNGQAGVYRLEELNASQAVLDASAGLKDLTTYYWRVKAIDVYGETTISSQVWSFSTNNNNAPYGILKGIVYSDQNFARLTAASVLGQVGEVSNTVFAELDGEYILLLPPGLASLNASNTGFISKNLSNVNVPVSTADEPYVELNIGMDGDADGDNVGASNDNCPEISNADQLDTDSDGQGDVCDADDDGDGFSDDREAQANSDPLDQNSVPAACDAGNYSDDGYVPCTLCEAGYYQYGTGATSCLASPQGHYVAVTGAATATECAVGTYQELTAQTSCTDAPAGTYVDITGAIAPTACPDGYYSADAGSITCTQCPVGTVSNDTHTACVSDIDEDGIADSLDNCPNDANTDQINTDGLPDGGDVCDDDDDQDGYSDAEESEAGTDPLDPNDMPRKSSIIIKLLPLLLVQ